jgi:hypothetical protein
MLVRAAVLWPLMYGGFAAASQLAGTFEDWRRHPAIEYDTRETDDPVARLMARMARGEVRLRETTISGYLPSLLEALGVPVESQLLLFSQTSLQRHRITRANPRAVYFNDSVSVAWVRGGFIEIAAQSPRQGVVFYALEGRSVATPRVARRHDCLQCHFSHRTIGVPGMLAPSDHTRALEQRWGGWYVTGRHGDLRHLGNEDVMVWPRPASTYNWPSVEGRFDATGYPSAHSDIAALLVFDHQMRMMNLLSRVNWESRVAGRVPDAAIAELVDYMLFVDEAPLTTPISGSSSFAEVFSRQAPRDRKGRSLRQLDLTTRLMRHPCSYMIYSAQFDALPVSVRAAVYQRLWQVLSGRDSDPRYARLSGADRRTIVEILLDTKTDLPVGFM